MDNKSRLVNCFSEIFGVGDVSQMAYRVTPLWDSIGHISLISRIEEEFDIIMEPEDMMGAKSFDRVVELLQNQYNIKI